MSSAMRLASSFGLGIGGGSASSSTTVQQYLTSRDNISQALREELDSGLLVNRYYERAFEKDEEFAEEFALKFGSNQRYTDSIITEITLDLMKEYLGTSLDEETGVVSFSINGKDESFVYDLAGLLVANTEEAFIDFKKEKSLSAVMLFKAR